MNMIDWATREIKLVSENGNPNLGGKELCNGSDYACYLLALKAYEFLVNYGHNDIGFRLTKNTLIRLMEGLPLTPINDEDFFSKNDNNEFEFESEENLKERGLKSIIQCPRMPSLFRAETIDGEVTYSDINICYCIDIHNPNYAYTNGLVFRIIEEMFPISMPYYPEKDKYKVYTEDFITDKKNVGFDTIGFLFYVTQKGEIVGINRFFVKEGINLVEISKEEYEKRKSVKLYPFKDENK